MWTFTPTESTNALALAGATIGSDDSTGAAGSGCVGLGAWVGFLGTGVGAGGGVAPLCSAGGTAAAGAGEVMTVTGPTALTGALSAGWRVATFTVRPASQRPSRRRSA